jgi:hypothetical protein
MTENRLPKYFEIVFALEGDSTMTSDFVLVAPFFPGPSVAVPLPEPPAADPFPRPRAAASLPRPLFRDSFFFLVTLANTSLRFPFLFPYILT